MASKANLIREYCKANGVSNVDFTSDLLLQDDMVGGVSNPYIKEWNVSGLAKPTDEQLASYETVANTAESNAQVDTARRVAYGPIADQLDMMYKDQVNGTTTWKAHVAKVKSDNPKS